MPQRPPVLETNQFYDLLHEMRQMLISSNGRLYQAHCRWNTQMLETLDKNLEDMQRVTLTMQAKMLDDLDAANIEHRKNGGQT